MIICSFFLLNITVFGYIIGRRYFDTYQEYINTKRIVVNSGMRGASDKFVMLFLFLNSCIWFLIDCKEISPDYPILEPWMGTYTVGESDYYFDDFDRHGIWFVSWGVCDVFDCCRYEQGDWGLPFNLSIHKFIIILFWFFFAKEFFLWLYYQYLDFIS